MSETKYTIGVDFGTESGRAVLVETDSGKEIATSVYTYKNKVIDRYLPVEGDPVILGSEWALQDPEDYIRTFQKTIPDVLALTKINPKDVVGVGIDFTACTMMPVKAMVHPFACFPITGAIRTLG